MIVLGAFLVNLGWGLALFPEELTSIVGRALVVAGGVVVARDLIDYAKGGSR